MRINRYFSCIDTHTGGEPTRTIIGGLPRISGDTIVDKMTHLKENMDWIRTALMYEPRGHSVMSGVVLTEPTHPEADIGVIFIETGGYLPMCGHDTIGVSTALVETGMVPVEEPVTKIALDTPAGLTRVRVEVVNGAAKSVTFRNVPSFAFAEDVEIDVPEMGEIKMGNRKKRGSGNTLDQVKHLRLQGKQVIIFLRLQIRKQFCQNPVLAVRVRVMLGFYFDHQMDLFSISLDDFGKRRNPRAAGFEFRQRRIPDAEIQAEHPAKVGVMDNDRIQIFGPAKVKLNSPDPVSDSPIKGIDGIFEYVPVIIIPPMRNNLALLQAISVGNRLWPAGIESIQDSPGSGFQSI